MISHLLFYNLQAYIMLASLIDIAIKAFIFHHNEQWVEKLNQINCYWLMAILFVFYLLVICNFTWHLVLTVKVGIQNNPSFTYSVKVYQYHLFLYFNHLVFVFDHMSSFLFVFGTKKQKCIKSRLLWLVSVFTLKFEWSRCVESDRILL